MRLQSALDTGDLELIFHDGRSIKAHSQKLKLASIGGALSNLIEDVVEDQITAGNKRKSDAVDLPGLKVINKYL